MINLITPFTYENSKNPWLMDKKNNKCIKINGNEISAKYLWSLNIEERKKCLKDVFNYYRNNGFPYLKLTNDFIIKEYEKLVKYDVNKVLTPEGYISNSSNLCIDLCRYFCRKLFYKVKGPNNSLSVEDVFFNDELFEKILKNRMGWNTSKEGGEERPYMFPISDKQILNGIRNSGYGFSVSNFRPVIAKWMYNHAIELLNINEDQYNIFDYSAGWGARALGALSLCNVNYYGTDPLTAECVANICDFVYTNLNKNITYTLYNNCSEDSIFNSNEFKNKFHIIGSCPPYFDLEVYSNDKRQSITDKTYEEWLNLYWKGTINNCSFMLKDNGIFILVIKETHGKYELKKDMEKIIIDSGLTKIEEYQYKTTTNHLSSKSRTGRTTKTNEYIIFFRK